MHFHIVKMYKDKEVKKCQGYFFINVRRKNIFDIYVTEYGTALLLTDFVCLYNYEF
jgi:hypothetical protein